MKLIWKRLGAGALSIALLSPAWLGGGGLTTLIGLVPLLWINHSYNRSNEGSSPRGGAPQGRLGRERSWWRVFGWALLTFVGWNLATCWWVGYATWVGPLGATLFSTWWSMVPFMLYHTVSKRAPKILSYTLLVTAWIACEFLYHQGSFSYPWLTLGNAFSNNIPLIQWYEYTGIFGGSLWVLLCNIFVFEILIESDRYRRRTAAVWAGVVILMPMVISQIIYHTYHIPTSKTVTASIVQPNIDPYKEFWEMTPVAQEQNLLAIASEAPTDVDVIVLPETVFQHPMNEQRIELARPVRGIVGLLGGKYPEAFYIVGVETIVDYDTPQTGTARTYRRGGYYDVFNASLGVDAAGNVQIHHKGKLVIGVENTPGWVFKALKFINVDLGGTTGSLGMGKPGPVFRHNGTGYGSAICWEAVYGEFYGRVVRDGAQVMCVSSNDGWWGDTPGHRLLFSYSQMRAVETRRAIVRSANTGTSGFIDSRGDAIEKLGWAQRGVLTQTVELNDHITFYTRYGDYVGRISLYVSILCLLYYIAYRVRRKNHLVTQ